MRHCSDRCLIDACFSSSLLLQRRDAPSSKHSSGGWFSVTFLTLSLLSLMHTSLLRLCASTLIGNGWRPHYITCRRRLSRTTARIRPGSNYTHAKAITRGRNSYTRAEVIAYRHGRLIFLTNTKPSPAGIIGHSSFNRYKAITPLQIQMIMHCSNP